MYAVHTRRAVIVETPGFVHRRPVFVFTLPARVAKAWGLLRGEGVSRMELARTSVRYSR